MTQRMQIGFTLIELIVAVSIVGILAAIAIPSYRNYVIRGQLVNATNGLSGLRVQMEQYFQDNRTYVDANGYSSPCDSPSPSGLFALSCSNVTASTYLIQAAGKAGSIVSGFTFTLDQNNNQATTAAPTGWSTGSCWLIKQGQTC